MTETLTEVPVDGVWSMKHIRELVEAGIWTATKFVPDETIPIGINGVLIWVTRGVEIEVPTPFYEVYRQSRMDTMMAAENAQKVLEKRSFGPGQTSVSMGWNGVDDAHPAT
jgi:hypothetical protein